MVFIGADPFFLCQTENLGEGFFAGSRGSKGLANLPIPALPYPSYPALCRQETTYAWRPALE